MSIFPRIKANIPNSITCLNLLCGAAACVFSFNYGEAFGALSGYQWAFVLMAASAVFDFADGAMARKLHVYSLLGKELDSLSDLVSFGLAPGALMFNTISYFNGGWTWWAFASLVIVLFGALRLARFNIDDRQTTYFIGLPIPANAIFWIGFVAWNHSHLYLGNLLTAVILVAFSSLMGCSRPMFSLKFSSFGWRENFSRYVIILATLLFVITGGLSGLAWGMIFYVVISLVSRKRIVSA